MTPCVSHHWTPWGMIYRAHDDDLGADGSPYGEGATEAEAVEDLKRQLEERE